MTVFTHLLEWVDFSSDLHFLTRTTMDTLDYSTSQINAGSKLVVAAAGPKKRRLATEFAQDFHLSQGFSDPGFAAPGMVVIQGPEFGSYESAQQEMNRLKKHLETQLGLESLPLFVVVDDAVFARKNFSNFLWVTFLRSNPSHDIYGVEEKFVFKHWGCREPLIIDARIKPFHSPPLESDTATIERVKCLAQRGGPLFGII